jgi:hypothetical protein
LACWFRDSDGGGERLLSVAYCQSWIADPALVTAPETAPAALPAAAGAVLVTVAGVVVIIALMIVGYH